MRRRKMALTSSFITFHYQLSVIVKGRNLPTYIKENWPFFAERRCMYSLIDFFVVWCGGYLLILHSADCDYILCLSNGQAKEFCLI